MDPSSPLVITDKLKAQTKGTSPPSHSTPNTPILTKLYPENLQIIYGASSEIRFTPTHSTLNTYRGRVDEYYIMFTVDGRQENIINASEARLPRAWADSIGEAWGTLEAAARNLVRDMRNDTMDGVVR